MPTKKRKQASKTPTPPGAAGTIKPIDQDKQKKTNKGIKSTLLSELSALKQRRNPTNFDNMNPISNRNALKGKKEFKFILFSFLY